MNIPAEWITEPVVHDDQNRLAIRFLYKKEWNEMVRELKGARWSRSMKCWHVQDNEYYRTLLGLNVSERKYLPKSNHDFAEGGIEKITEFTRWMRSRNYSENTIKTYTDALKIFLKYYGKKTISEITNKDVIDFNNDYIRANSYSVSFQNQTVNALKLFFKIVKDTKIETEKIHRPRREKKLPNVLSKEEVKQILNALSNIKHRTMLSLIYSCGLRCSELINLKPEHIDSKRNLLLIKSAKGFKDRIAPLSNKTLEILRTYYGTFKPERYMFEGQYKGEPYDARSLQLVLKTALSKTQITKPVTLHWLRHSYATHLLESGTDLRYIQEILGHKSSKTTEIYTHVSTRSIQKIITPFDDL